MVRPSPPRFLLYVLIVVALVVAIRSHDSLPGGRVAAIGQAVRAEMTRQGIPGLSVAIVDDGRMVWTGGFGLADVENEIPATDRTAYRLASISKPITALAICQLAERGRIDLDAPIQRYVPGFPVKPWPITCRLLLSHLGGIRTYQGDELASTRHYDTVMDSLAIFQDDPLACEPGTRFLYTTYGYNLLGAVVREVAGRRYIQYVRENIFRPAGMDHARADDNFEIILHRARGYTRTASGAIQNSGMADTSNKIPGGGLCATVVDLARFAIALQEDSLLDRETLETMYHEQQTSRGVPVGYGLGWQISRNGDHKEVWHMGSQQRVSTLLYMVPNRRVAVVLLSNLEGAALMPLARRIADLYLP